jgi:hypothetical protein
MKPPPKLQRTALKKARLKSNFQHRVEYKNELTRSESARFVLEGVEHAKQRKQNANADYDDRPIGDDTGDNRHGIP